MNLFFFNHGIKEYKLYQVFRAGLPQHVIVNFASKEVEEQPQ